MATVKQFLTSFEADFGSLETDIKRYSQEVKEEILLAAHKAEALERKLESAEREAAARHRKLGVSFFRKADNGLEEINEWRAKFDRRHARKHRYATTSTHYVP